MRFSSYVAGIVGAALMLLVPAAQAQTISLIISETAPPYASPPPPYPYNSVTVPLSDTASLSKFTIDGLTFNGAQASLSGNAINFNTFGVSGPEGSAPLYISVIVKNSGLPVSSFYTNHGYSSTVVSTSSYTGYSDVYGVTDASLTAPVTGNVTGAVTPVTTTGSTIALYLTLSGYKPSDGITPSISGATVLTVPEPNAVLIGLLGLPCMGAVVFFARRRSAAMAALVA
jgi:hypothetical protein